jgi:hypothetical protein
MEIAGTGELPSKELLSPATPSHLATPLSWSESPKTGSFASPPFGGFALVRCGTEYARRESEKA